MDFGGQPLLKMNNGLMIPQLGFGVYLIKDLSEAEKACLEYDNEKGVNSHKKMWYPKKRFIHYLKIISN